MRRKPEPGLETGPNPTDEKNWGKVEKELMRGAGVIAVLKLLDRRDMYGYEMIEALNQQSEGVLAMGQSTLYPMLYNLESKLLVEATRRKSPEGRWRKYYRLTPKGRSWLESRETQWGRLVQAMAKMGLAR